MDYSQWTSSSASSPFSLSTDDSSPEAIVNGNGNGQKVTTPPTMPQHLLNTVPGNLNQILGYGADIKPVINGNHIGQQHHYIPPPSAFSRLPPNHQQNSVPHVHNAVPQGQGGAKHDKPPRRYPTDQLPLLSPPVNDIYEGTKSSGIVLLQGDPQVITKQRVETAIRVILDLCHLVPTHVVPPPIDPAIHSLLPRGPDGNALRHIARTGTFKTLRLQAGATTKQMSKKQEQARELARKGDPYGLDQSTLYLETAVYKSDGQTRVYACKRCRAREEKRRKTKESSRKTPLTEPTNHVNPKSSLSPRPKPEISPSPDYVTGDNADDYDPMKARQTVEEPQWDPHVPDWRHEIITFNSSPEWPFKEPGTVDWLPLRVICYGKCHGEKTGFKIRFTVRTHDGRIFASSMTDPIRITDDHKTDKAKPRSEMSRSAPAARSRKGTSVMSSRRTSPNLSDESQQSMSQAGAVVQKFTPQSKGNKPYDRPSALHRHNSSSSVHSVASLSAISNEMRTQFPDIPSNSADWSSVDHTAAFNLRQPFRGAMTPLHGDTSSYTSSNPPSVHSSARQSPLALQEDLPLDLQAQFSVLGQLDQSLGQLSEQQSQQHQMFPTQTTSPMLYNAMNGLQQFNTSDPFSSNHHPSGSFSASSYTSSYLSDTSALGLNMSGSLYSESGLPPSSADGDENMMDYLTFGADAGEYSNQPQTGFPSLEAPRMPPTSQSNHQAAPFESRPNAQPPQPARNPPVIGMLAPESGPMSGGINVIILGTNFTTDMVVTFGGRPAQLVSVNETALACLLPPSSVPGPVELKVQDSNVSAVTKFVYNGVTQETMELAVRVRDRGPGANGNETATGSSGTQQSNGTGTGTNGISNQAQSGSNPTQTNSLQTTLTDYIASIDEPSPGSLRHSGAINTRNDVQQTLVHLATVLGYEKLLRHLLVYGAQLDIPDVNGFTPLAFAAYCGQISCARVLIQAGATYDVPTYMGEFPLDLARSAGNTAIEQLLLSAVWSTASTSSAVPEGVGESLEAVKVPHGDDNDQSCNEVEDDLYSSDDDDEYAVETDIELDSDNPSDESDDDVDAFGETAPSRRPSKHKGTRPRIVAPDNTSIRANAPTSIRNSMSEEIDSGDESEDSALDAFKLSPRPRRRSRRSGSSNSADKVLPPSPTIDTPPPYSPATWRDKFPLTEQWKIPIAPQPLASMFYPRAADMPTDGAWITLPVSTPSWETLQKLTSPEEVKAFTQAMTAAALNAIISSGATTATATSSTPNKPRKRRSGRRSSGSGSASARATATLATGTENATATSTTTTVSVKVDTASSTTSKVIKPIKRDRMLFYFWLPLLLFFGFWIFTFMLPIFTAFGLFYARTIRQFIKQRI